VVKKLSVYCFLQPICTDIKSSVKSLTFSFLLYASVTHKGNYHIGCKLKILIGFGIKDFYAYIVFVGNVTVDNGVSSFYERSVFVYESSLLFASEVVGNLMKKPLAPRKIVIDQDIFQVLVEANMPAVLLELAFVTNPAEYKYLSSPAGQDEVADRLLKAFGSYKTKFDQSVSVERAPVQKQTPPVPPQQKESVSSYYSIQIMGLSRLLKKGDPALKGLVVTPVKVEGKNVYKYIYGKYSSADEARADLPKVRKKFPDAFAVKVADGVVEKIK